MPWVRTAMYLRKVSCEKQQDPADSTVDVLRAWPFLFPAELFSLFSSLLVFKMTNTDASLVLGSVLRSKESNRFLRGNYSGKQRHGNICRHRGIQIHILIYRCMVS